MSLLHVKGIGPKRAAALRSIGIETLEQLLYYAPRDYLDRSRIATIGSLSRNVADGKEVTVIGTVHQTSVRRTKRGRQMFFLVLKDETGYLTCVFYEGIQFYRDAFETGEVLAVSSVPELDRLNRVQFIHPEFDRLRTHDEEDDTDWSSLLNTGAIIPKYASSEALRKVGLDSRGFRRIIRDALRSQSSAVPEHLPDSMRSELSLPDIRTALNSLHFPQSEALLAAARRRLSFDELFFFQLLMAYRRREVKLGRNGIAFHVQSALAKSLLQSLPFDLTAAQKRVMSEIAGDMKSAAPMNRLLQGDVGSGKTIVALFAMLIAIDDGWQAAFMAPTEILAEQHFRTMTEFVGELPVNLRLLIGGQRKRLREDILEDIRRGSAQIVVGTHALIERAVEFARLGLVVVDEQHRFGVAQRSELRKKGSINPDVLVMTATPIPRTLAMTVYGDLDVSILDEMPKDRRVIRTAIRTGKDKERVFGFVREEIARGRQAYIVYPLIEESEKVDLKAAVAEYERLRKDVFPGLRVGLLHGRLPSDEKEVLMRQFKRRELDILVSTTVIEVGIDVPNATIMVVENAERFGLSQLHQLRGRVGRGLEQSYCVLLTDELASKRRLMLSGDRHAAVEEARASEKRLQTMVETTDGFRIAEVDLELRGPGEFFGTRQSGIPEFRFANLVTDAALLRKARDEANAIVERDPQLRLPQHAGIRKEFEREHRDYLSFVRVG